MSAPMRTQTSAAKSAGQKSFLLVGEAMALFMAKEEGPLSAPHMWTESVAGAEFNVGVGLLRLGHATDYVTRLGCDPLGDYLLSQLMGAGFAVDGIQRDASHPTGHMLKGFTHEGDPEIYYYRASSAASAFSAADVEALDLRQYHTVHLTGIFPALSETCHEAAVLLARKARAAGAAVTFDPNLRPQLWGDLDQMTAALRELASLADVVLPGIGECQAVVGTSDPYEAARRWLALGPELVIIKLGPAGALWATADGATGVVPGFIAPQVVDTVGAGDGFAAGVLSALVEGLEPVEAALRGCAIGAIQVTHRSDNEGLPTRDELESFMAKTPRAELLMG